MKNMEMHINFNTLLPKIASNLSLSVILLNILVNMIKYNTFLSSSEVVWSILGLGVFVYYQFICKDISK